MRYLFLCSAVLFLSGALPVHPPRMAAAPAPSSKPNILLIMADDMGFSDIGCYGGEVKTPHIDQLSREGIRLTRFYNNAWCSPTRASLLTGLYPQQAGMSVLAGPKPGPPGPNEGYLSARSVTLAEVLKQNGYYTAMSGKWHVGEYRPHWPVDRGFDHYFGLISGAANYFDITKTKSKGLTRYMALDGQRYFPPKQGFYMTRAITDDAVRVLERRKSESQPFFLYVAYTAPHWPLQAPPEDIAPYLGTYRVGWDSIRMTRYHRLLRLGIISPGTSLSPADSAVTPWDQLTPARQKQMADKMAVYAAQISDMDRGIGRILQALKETGREENTLVIFLSDNGGCAEGGVWGFDKRHNGIPPGGVDSYMSYGESWANVSNTPFRYYKKWLEQGGIAAPFIVRWPAGISPDRDGSILDQTGHVIDLMPTLCALTGAIYPRSFKGNRIIPMQGQSLLSVIRTGKIEPHRPVFWSLRRQRAVLFDHYSLVSSGEKDPWELYDLREDRSELHDLARKDTLLVSRYARLWKQWAGFVGIAEGGAGDDSGE